MKKNNNELVEELLTKIPLLETKQLIIAITKNSPETNKDEAMKLLIEKEKAGELLLSCDGFCMTKGMYQKLTKDKFYDKCNKTTEIQIVNPIAELAKDELKEQRACLWTAIDMIPNVDEIMVSGTPFNLVFTTYGYEEKDNKIYEIFYVEKGKEIIKGELIKAYGKPHKDVANHVRRVAILEDENNANIIPYVGINFICKLANNKTGYDVIENRKKEIYKDYE